jgi:hypothetical protein
LAAEAADFGLSALARKYGQIIDIVSIAAHHLALINSVHQGTEHCMGHYRNGQPDIRSPIISPGDHLSLPPAGADLLRNARYGLALLCRLSSALATHDCIP